MVQCFLGDSLREKMDRSHVTAAMVAKRTGYSTATVSLHLNGKYAGKDKTREISAAIDQLVVEAEKGDGRSQKSEARSEKLEVRTA
jgi:DNA transposition AAA+ family ATPase